MTTAGAAGSIDANVEKITAPSEASYILVASNSEDDSNATKV